MEIENTLQSAARIVSELDQESTNTFEVLDNLKEYFQEVLNLGENFIRNLCYSVLCGGFILLKCCYANLKKTIQEMEKVELPERLQPRVREIKSYFTSMKEKLQELDNAATEIRTTVSTLLKEFCANFYQSVNCFLSAFYFEPRLVQLAKIVKRSRILMVLNYS